MEKEDSIGAATNICINDVVSFQDAEKMMYCRLCATVHDDAVSIFGEEGIRLNLASKINVALPIWVSSNMGPPLHVCKKCIETLETTVNFINQVVASQKKINAIFKVLQDISKRNVPSPTSNRDSNIPAFITYFRSKNFKKLDTINRISKRDTEKENEGEKDNTTVGHKAKKVDDSMSSLAIKKSLSTENNATTHGPPCMVDIHSDDDSLGGNDFNEPVEDTMESNVASSAGDGASKVVADQNGPVNTSTNFTSNVNTKSLKGGYGNVCKYCNRSFKWSAELLFHHTSAHQDFVFCCRVCFKVFYDDKEEFKKHVMSHSVEADAARLCNEGTPPNSDPSNPQGMENSCSTQSQRKAPEKLRLNYICKYCSMRYSNLDKLFSHQTEVHPDLVFRCSHCSKVFYENIEEFRRHEECHGKYKNKFKLSDGADIDEIMRNKSPGVEVVHSALTEKQQEWVNRILSEKHKKGFGNHVSYSTSPSVNENGNISLPENADANISHPLDSNSSTLSSLKSVVNFSPSVNTNRILDNLISEDRPVPKMSLGANYSIRVISNVNNASVPNKMVKTYICKACKVGFSTEEERELHRFYHHRLKLPCRFCPRTLAHKSKLLQHEATHFKKPKFTCKKCEEEFDDEEMLKKHKRTHSIVHTLPRFSCQICKRLYIRENELKIHLETHLDERPFLCEKCGQCFKDVPSLREHRSTPCKAQSRGYECEICKKKFRNARMLTCHRIRKHRAMYPCPLCGLVFRSKPAMRGHMESHSEIRCIVCDESFENLDQLQNHRKREHPEEEMTEFSAFQDEETRSVPSLACEECDKCFATELTLSLHKAKHSNESVWHCHLCNEKFDTKYQLENHMSSHPGERPHKCSICDRTFTARKSLMKHEKVHFPEEGHLCIRCNKSFPTAVELSKHLAEHTSYNSFTCHFCSKSFSQKISLLIHQRSHTNRVYSCSMCPENFSQLKLLQEHERTHAKNKTDTETASTNMDEDSLAISLLNMSEAIVGVGSDGHILEEVITSVNVDHCGHVAVKEGVDTNIIIDPVYSEVVYATNALDVSYVINS